MNKKTISTVAATILVAGLFVGCGSSSSDKGTTPKPETVTKKITVIDSPVQGAQVSVKGAKAGKKAEPTKADGTTEVEYEKSIENPLFISEGGKTAAGIEAPTMQSKGDVINPYTTMDVAGKDISGSFKLSDEQKKHAMGNYSTVQDTEFAKATVAIASLIRCMPVVDVAAPQRAANDNATKVADIVKEAVKNAANPASVIATLGTADTPAKTILAEIANISNASGQTVADIEQALQASGKTQCDTADSGNNNGNDGSVKEDSPINEQGFADPFGG